MKLQLISKTLVALSLFSLNANASAEPVIKYSSADNPPKQHYIINKNSLITDFGNSNPIIAKSADTAQANTKTKKIQPKNAIEIKYGMYSSGFWFPVQPQNGINNWEYNSCNSFFFCSEDGLFGGNVELKYIRRLVSSGRHNFDLDTSGSFGWQSPQISRSISLDKDFAVTRTGGETQFFGTFSVVPTYRFNVNEWLGLGIGAGINYATDIPDDIGGNQLNAAANFEIAVKPLSSKDLELTFAFQHRCAFFGTLNEEGESSGSNWYALGLRKWF